jgi:putative flippase GtrA
MLLFLKFSVVGVLNTIFGLSCIYLAMYVAGMNYILANGIGYSFGFGVSFLLNGTWTFRHRGSYGPSLGRWLMVTSAAYGLNLAVIVASRRWIEVDVYFAQIFGVAVYAIVSFFGGRHFAFVNDHEES